eukprot:m.69499 g.69499  ORF g.69499 m.69499 type:complete len:706 (-) comp13992_c0_seq2:43-2160(-)
MPARGKDNHWDDDEVLQAIVLSDAFTNRFMPLSSYLPRALMPVANTPLIDYTLEFLAAAGVQEVYVLCGAHADKVEAYIKQSKYADEPRFTVKTYRLQRCLNVGDALREIDALGIHIRGTFVLVTGDIVSNCRLDAIEKHNARVAGDKTNSTIMTMLFKHTEPGHRLRSAEDELAVALESDTGLLLSYEQLANKDLHLSLGAFAGRPKVEFRTNLVDCHVYVCSPEVKMLFADNFDYECMSDLVKDVVERDESQICEYRVYGEVIRDEYAARVGSLQSYNAVSMDIMQRWTYPLVPDLFSSSGACATHKGRNVYVQPGVYLSRTSVLKRSVVIGSESRIGRDSGPQTTITNSVIGRGCTIGTGVTLDNAYLWDGVVVDDNCTITSSVLAHGVHVKHDVIINKGCLLSKDVVVGPDLNVPANSKFSLTSSKPDFNDFSSDEDEDVLAQASEDTITPISAVPYNTDHVGEEGKGFLWQVDEDNPEYRFNHWDPPAIDDDEQSDTGSVSSFDMEESEEEYEFGLPSDPFTAFYEEVLDVIRERVRRVAPNFSAVQVDNVALEISASRAAHDMTPKDTARAIVTSIVGSSDAFDTAKETVLYLKQTYLRLGCVLGNYIKSRDDQLAAINAIEDACTTSDYAAAGFQTILHGLYNDDVLEEESILSWYKTHDSQDELKKKLHTQVKPLIEWLENAEEESDEGESSEEDSD